jgi:hypothetical protein
LSNDLAPVSSRRVRDFKPAALQRPLPKCSVALIASRELTAHRLPKRPTADCLRCAHKHTPNCIYTARESSVVWRRWVLALATQTGACPRLCQKHRAPFNRCRRNSTHKHSVSVSSRKRGRVVVVAHNSTFLFTIERIVRKRGAFLGVLRQKSVFYVCKILKCTRPARHLATMRVIGFPAR